MLEHAGLSHVAVQQWGRPTLTAGNCDGGLGCACKVGRAHVSSSQYRTSRRGHGQMCMGGCSPCSVKAAARKAQRTIPGSSWAGMWASELEGQQQQPSASTASSSQPHTPLGPLRSTDPRPCGAAPGKRANTCCCGTADPCCATCCACCACRGRAPGCGCARCAPARGQGCGCGCAAALDRDPGLAAPPLAQRPHWPCALAAQHPPAASSAA